MSALRGKIDFTLFISADNANPNGDPLNGNRPRINLDGYGEISDVCIKRKIRNRLQDLGQKIFVQSDDRSDDGYTSLKDRADGCEELKAQLGNKKNANRDACAAIACKEWLDVRAFGQVFAFKGIPVSFGVTFLNLFLPAAVCVFTSYVINTNILSPTSRKMVDIHQDLLSKIAPITSFEHMVPFPILFSLLEMDA